MNGATKIPFKDFIKFQTDLTFCNNSKYIGEVAKAAINQLVNCPYGSAEWIVAREELQRYVGAVETFNMWRQIFVMLIAVGKRAGISDDTVRIMQALVDQWDVLFCSPRAIENYIEYYKDATYKPQHPVMYALKSFGHNAIQQVDTTRLSTALGNFMNQFEVVGRTLTVPTPPEQTETPLEQTTLEQTEPRPLDMPSLSTPPEEFYDMEQLHDDLELSDDELEQHMLT